MSEEHHKKESKNMGGMAYFSSFFASQILA